MNTIIRTTLLLLLLSAFSGVARAQDGLNCAILFQKYGKQKGVTMVELSKDMLDSYRIALYKSLVFKDVTEVLPDILENLSKDKKGGSVKKIQDVLCLSEYLLIGKNKYLF